MHFISSWSPSCFFAFSPISVTQAVEHSAVKIWILLYGGSILHGGCLFVCFTVWAIFRSNQWSTTGP